MIRIMIGVGRDIYGYVQLDDTKTDAKIEVTGYDVKDAGPESVRAGDLILNMLRHQRLPGEGAADLLRALPSRLSGGYGWAKDMSPPPSGHERSRAS